MFPKNIDIDNVSPLDEFVLKDRMFEFPVLYLCHSSNKKEIEIKESKLTHFIDSGKHLNKESSLRFLESSFCQDKSVENVSVLDESQSSTTSPVPTSSKRPQDPINELMAAQCVSTKLTKLCQLTEENNNLLKDSIKEQIKFRKLMQRHFPPNPQRVIQEEREDTKEPVLFNGQNLVTLGSKNLDKSNFALVLARRLWSDDELKTYRLLPKRSKTGRPEFSPTKTQLFINASCNRFNIEPDSEELTMMARAVNQLGNDLVKDKRKR